MVKRGGSMNRGTAAFGVLLIVVGVVLLAAILLGFDAWRVFWPTIIIAAGLWILWGATAVGRHAPESESASLQLEGAGSAALRLRHGAGRLHVTGGAAPGALFAGTFVGGVEVRSTRRGDILDADLSVPSPAFFFPFPWLGWRELSWDVRLSEAVPLALRVESGASQTMLDLTNLRVGELRVGTGASATEIRLPSAAGTTKVRIDGGAASVKLWVPQGVGARIRAEGGLSEIKVDRTRFPRQGIYHQSADYETAANKVDMTVQMGVGSVEVN
jgi:hypothetical protein